MVKNTLGRFGRGLRHLAFVLLPAVALASSGVEEQRKYSVVPAHSNEMLKLAGGLGPFSFERHQTYQVADIYLETPGRRMEREGYSLRFRRADKGPAKREYAFQFKSEMESPGVARMEAEWKDLESEEVSGKSLPVLIDAILERGYVEDFECAGIAAWFTEKMGSALAPFQELRRRGMEGEKFCPRVIGRQDRVRFHVLVDRRTVRGELAALPSSERTKQDVPESFLKNRARVWLMEASLDASVFTSAKKGVTGRHLISELEVENKYRPRETGTHLLDQLERLLKEKYPINIGQASKYLQAVTHLEGAR